MHLAKEIIDIILLDCPLAHSIALGDIFTSNKLLKADLDIYKRLQDKGFSTGILEGHPEIITHLCKKYNMKPEQCHINWTTDPQYVDINQIRFLIEHGANVKDFNLHDIVGREGGSKDINIAKNHIAAIETLLGYGANIHYEEEKDADEDNDDENDDEYEDTLLITAIRTWRRTFYPPTKEYIEMMMHYLIVEKMTDVRAKGYLSHTALHVCAQWEQQFSIDDQHHVFKKKQMMPVFSKYRLLICYKLSTKFS